MMMGNDEEKMSTFSHNSLFVIHNGHNTSNLHTKASANESNIFIRYTIAIYQGLLPGSASNEQNFTKVMIRLADHARPRHNAVFPGQIFRRLYLTIAAANPQNHLHQLIF